jgi:hypothetical protein
MRTAYKFRFGASALVLGLALASCSGGLTPPEDIGNETVSSVKPARRVSQQAYPSPQDPVQAADNIDYIDTPNLAGVGRKVGSAPESDDLQSSNNSGSLGTLPASSQNSPGNGQSGVQESSVTEVNIDSQLGVAAPTSLAQEEANQIAEGVSDQPVVDGIGTDAPTMVQGSPEQAIPFSQAQEANQITLPKRQKSQPQQQVAYIPRFSDPMQVPESYGGMSAADKSCISDLQKLGVRFEQIAPISNGPACGIAHPLLVSGFSGDIQLKPAAKLNCQLTRMFAKYVKNEVVPSARYRYFSGVKTITQMSSYSCRKMNSQSNNPWSEHAHGNAIDIGGFVLNNGKEIDVRKKGFFQFREKGLLKTVREDSCRYFTTVLGPGDPYHGNHFHFDLRTRKSGYRHCSL